MTDAPVSPGDVIADKYRVERVLGAGGMGVVVVAVHLQLDQRVAIKFLLPALATDTEAVARFAREARAAARIQSEHVARVLDVATGADGAPYIVMEYLEGKDLEATLEEQGPLPIDRAIDYLLQALEALAEAHAAGIVHRDLKPANMFLARRPDGSSMVKLLDFGISKVLRRGDPSLTTTAAQMGSPLYMSPEQLRRTRDVDARADIWSLGVILYQLVTGDAPFIADTLPRIIAAILTERAPPMRERRADVPAALDAIVGRCLEKEPSARFADVGELARALQPFAPQRSLVSVERVSRIISGNKTKVSGAPPPPPGPGRIHEAATIGTNSSWHTSAHVKPSHNGLKVAALVAGGILLATGTAAFVRLTRQAPAAPPAASRPADALAAQATSARPVLVVASSAPATEVPSAAPAVEPAAAPASTAARVGPKAPATPALPAGRTSPAVPAVRPPATPGTSDFGGRR